MQRPEVRETGEPMTLARFRREVDGLLGNRAHVFGNRIVIKFLPWQVEPYQAVLHWLTILGTLIRREINGPRREVDREGDDAGDEEEQAHGIERDDAPVEFARRLPPSFGVQDCSAARRAGGGNK